MIRGTFTLILFLEMLSYQSGVNDMLLCAGLNESLIDGSCNP